MTDEELSLAYWQGRMNCPTGSDRDLAGRRAIESAATAPLLERIAELEADCDRLEKYWNHALATHENIDALKSRIAELEAKLAYANEVIDQRNAMVSAALSAAPAAPEQQDQSEQHLGMVECRHCGGTGDAPYMTTSPVPYQRTEKCATCDGAGMVAQAPNAQQAEHVTEVRFGNIQQAEAQEPCAWMWQHDETGMTGFVQNAPKDELLHWERMNKPRRIVAPLFTRPQPAQLTAGDDRRHVICLCPDCIKPKDAPTAVQGEQP